MWTNLIGSIPARCVFFQHFFTTYTLRFLMKSSIKSTFRANWLRTFYSLVLLLGGYQVLFSQTTWNGSVSSNWHDDANWSTGVKPTAADNVIIPNVATDPTISAAAVAKNVVVNAGGVLTIAAAGSLAVEGAAMANAISNTGTVNNHGTITIGAVLTAGFNGIRNEGAFTNHLGGQIQVDRAIDAGIANFSSGTFTNEAIITIGGIISPGNSGIANGGIFNNNSAAQIQINRSTLYGLINGGTFNNDGSLTLGANFSIGIHGIFSNGTINNNIDGQIQIDRAGSTSGVFNNVGGSFQNKGDLNIGAIAVGIYGLLNNAAFSNQVSGQILIQRANDASILNEGANVTLDNYGTLTIAANNGGGIRNFSSATIHNRPCGQIFLYKRLNNTATYTNEGLFRVDFGASAHVNTGTLTNNSIIEYPQGNPIPNVVNNEITVAPTTANTCDVINPAFGLGNPVDFTIAGIFTDAAATMSAGTYTTATNTFTPTSVLTEGSYTFYVKIEDGNGGCTRIATWKLTTENCCDAPEAICKSATIALVGNSASLSVSDVNNGSTYECGLQSITVSPNSFSCSQVGTPQTVTLTVTDVKGNSDACQTTVTVQDNTAPTVVCKNFTTNLSTTGTASINTTNVFQSGSDNCGNVTQVSVMPNAFTCANLGANTVVLTVNDGNSNMATCSATVTVVDAIAPTIICPANIVRATDLNQCNAIVNYTTPTIASDNCAGAVTSHFSGGVSGAVFQKGTTTVIWRATDGGGLTSSCSFSITVNDTQKPNITCPVNQTRSNDLGLCSAVVTYPTPTGTDNCGLPTGQPVWISGGTNAAGSTATFQKGATIVIWRATDAAGNAQTCSFRVTVNDTEAPTMTCPIAISLSTAPNTCSAVATYTNPTFTDNCAPTTGTAVRITGLVSGSTFPVGNSNVVFQATDAAGNTRRCTMVVRVVDNQLPVINCPAAIVLTGAGTPCTATVIYPNATASDNCAATLTPFLITGLASGSVFPAGVTINTFKALTPNGQSAECSFTVTVNCGSGMSNSGLDDRDKDLEALQTMTHKTSLGLTIAPNPAIYSVTMGIEGVDVNGGTLLVFDQIGRLVQQQVIASEQRTTTLQVAEFAPGLYRIMLRTDLGMVTKTLVVVKE
jgi:HYR domain